MGRPSQPNICAWVSTCVRQTPTVSTAGPKSSIASATLKPVFLELGGKSVNLFLDDADLESALPGAVTSCMHGGQGCAIPSRIMVPRHRYDEAVDLVRSGFDSWSYGDPTDPALPEALEGWFGPASGPVRRLRGDSRRG